MTSRTRRISAGFLALILLILFSPVAIASDPPSIRVTGTLSEIEGVPILRVWGTPNERGFAHGYLLGKEIVSTLGTLFQNDFLGPADAYPKNVLPKLKLMTIEPRYEAELRGMLAGIEARVGGPAKLAALGRPLQYEDLLAITCTGNLERTGWTGCSSFAAWGPMTEDGNTLAGRNMDWPAIPALIGTQIILVQVPSPEGDELGWISVTWPSYIGCITGMNAEGVSVATHDAGGHEPSATRGLTPYGLTFRNAVESARAGTAMDDIARVIREGISIVGNNMMVTRPYTGKGPAAAVFEFDADLSDGGGLTTRQPEDANHFLICTNHFRKRSPPVPCNRYAKLTDTLSKIAKRQGKYYVTPKRAWGMLGSVHSDTVLTHHSVVFEPNKRLMHVAFAEGPQKHAPKCKHVTLDVAKLLKGDYPGGK